jgi:hypothetical protein
MLVMASAASVGVTDDPFTVQQARQKIARMVKTSLDPNTVLKGTELLSKLEQLDKDRGETPQDDGLEAWRLERDFLTLPNGATAFLLTMLDGLLMGNVCNLHLLHDTYPALMQQKFGPQLWGECIARLPAAMRTDLDKWLADPKYQYEERKTVWAEVGVNIDKITKAA